MVFNVVELLERVGSQLLARSTTADCHLEEISQASLYSVFRKLYPDNEILIAMMLFSERSPFEPDNEYSTFSYVKQIETFIESGINKPIISVFKNHLDSSWDLMVILFENDIPPKIFFRNSKYHKISPLVKYLFQNELKHHDDEASRDYIVGGKLNQAQIVDEEEFGDIGLVKENEGGWWALFRIILILRNRDESDLPLIKSWTLAFQAMQKYLNEYEIILKMNNQDLYAEESEDTIWYENQLSFIKHSLDENISKWDNEESKASMASDRIVDKLEFLDRVLDFPSNSLSGTPTKPYQYNNIDWSVSKTDIKLKDDYSFSPDNSIFEELINSKHIFVDKSLFIKEIIDHPSNNILITRPKSWGKSLNLDMLRVFLSNTGDININAKNKALFTSKRKGIINGLTNNPDSEILAIAAEEYESILNDYAGQIPVIFITFPIVRPESNQDINAAIHECFGTVIENAYSYHKNVFEILKMKCKQDYDEGVDKMLKTIYKYLYKQPNSDLGTSIQFLSRVLYEYYNKKVFIIIDEYDSPFKSSFSGEYHDAIRKFVEKLIKFSIKDSKESMYVQKTIITGTLSLAKSELSSCMNNFSVHTVISPMFSDYFGFTDNEIDMILKQASIYDTDSALKINKKKIASWYDGYNIGGKKIYNPFSIMNCLFNARMKVPKIFKPYWISTGDELELAPLFNDFTPDEELSELLRTGYLRLKEELPEQIIIRNAHNDKTQLFWLMLHSGYLTPLQKSANFPNSSENEFFYVVPNKEVKKHVFDLLLTKWLETLKIQIPSMNLTDLVNSLNENLEKTDEYCATIRDEILKHWGSSNRNEIDFQILIGWPAFIAGIAKTNMPKHEMFNGIVNIERKALDALYIPIKEKSTCVVIHEYKKFYNAGWECAKGEAVKAIIQIYEKGYMNEALRMFEHPDNSHKYFTHILVRGIVFHQVKPEKKWHLTVVYLEHTIPHALKIRDYFRNNINELKKCKKEIELQMLISNIENSIDGNPENRKRKHSDEEFKDEKVVKLAETQEDEENENISEI